MGAASPPQALNRLFSHEPGFAEACRARHIVMTLGGRFSLELGIDVDLDEHEIDRWALGATLVGDPSPVAVGIRTYRVLESTGIRTLEDVRGCDRAELTRLLREGGYAPNAKQHKFTASCSRSRRRYPVRGSVGAAWRGSREPTRARASPLHAPRLERTHRWDVPSRAERSVAGCRSRTRPMRGSHSPPRRAALQSTRTVGGGGCRTPRSPGSRSGARTTGIDPQSHWVPGRRGVPARGLRPRATRPLLTCIGGLARAPVPPARGRVRQRLPRETPKLFPHARTRRHSTRRLRRSLSGRAAD